jgi:hypothetical protein
MQTTTVTFNVTYVKAMRRTESLRLIIDLEERVVAATKRGGKTRHFPCASFAKVEAASGVQAEHKFVLNTVIRHANGKRSKKVYWFITPQDRASFCQLLRMVNEYGLQAKEMYTQLNASRTGKIGVEDLQATCKALRMSASVVDLQTMVKLVKDSSSANEWLTFRDFFRFYATIPNLEIDKLMGHWLSLSRQAQGTASASKPQAKSSAAAALSSPGLPATLPKPLLTTSVKEDWFEEAEGANDAAEYPLPLLPGEEVLLAKQGVTYCPTLGGKGLGQPGEGRMWMTSYRIVFKQILRAVDAQADAQVEVRPEMNQYPHGPLPPAFTTVHIPLFSIEGMELTTGDEGSQRMQLQCKDCRSCALSFSSENSSPKIDSKWMQALVARLRKLCFAGVEKAFAFVYRLELPNADMDGWSLFDPSREFERQGLNFGAGSSWQLFGDGYQISSTYPMKYVMPCAAQFSLRDLAATAAFRSRARVPAVTWVCSTGAVLVRSSQPNVGFTGKRCEADEKLLNLYRLQGGAGRNSNTSSTDTSSANTAEDGMCLHIVDARGKMAAEANKMKRKGYEAAENYRNCTLSFMDIRNIHTMRESLQAVRQVLYYTVLILHATVLYCIVLHCTHATLHCTPLYSTVLMLYSTVLYCIVLYCTHTTLHCTVLYSTVLILHSNPLYCTPLYCTHATLHCTPLHCTALYSTLLHCTPLHVTPLYSTPPYCGRRASMVWTATLPSQANFTPRTGCSTCRVSSTQARAWRSCCTGDAHRCLCTAVTAGIVPLK